ncbi:unnamed protein product [Larinioides sclopetarius]|uniref:Uncharacterized protein n=1 Tax=Larinioides sclopetarius TaxID=280406 RepID=A0AAV2AAF0_9ARAC
MIFHGKGFRTRDLTVSKSCMPWGYHGIPIIFRSSYKEFRQLTSLSSGYTKVLAYFIIKGI